MFALHIKYFGIQTNSNMEDTATTETETAKRITQLNGQIVTARMRELGEPTTLGELTQLMADETTLPADDVRVEVRRFLRAGTTHGFVRRDGNRYELPPEWTGMPATTEAAAAGAARAPQRGGGGGGARGGRRRRSAKTGGGAAAGTSGSDASGAEMMGSGGAASRRQPSARRRRTSRRRTSANRRGAAGASGGGGRSTSGGGARSRSRRGPSSASSGGGEASTPASNRRGRRSKKWVDNECNNRLVCAIIIKISNVWL